MTTRSCWAGARRGELLKSAGLRPIERRYVVFFRAAKPACVRSSVSSAPCRSARSITSSALADRRSSARRPSGYPQSVARGSAFDHGRDTELERAGQHDEGPGVMVSAPTARARSGRTSRSRSRPAASGAGPSARCGPPVERASRTARSAAGSRERARVRVSRSRSTPASVPVAPVFDRTAGCRSASRG